VRYADGSYTFNLTHGGTHGTFERRRDRRGPECPGSAARRAARAWIALAITVCRANPRAHRKIEQLALQWAVRRAQALEEAGLASPASHMHTQLEVLLQAIRVELAADAKQKR